MPFYCEECNIKGARLNNIIQKRLCKNCLHTDNYKLICKSEVIKKYKLSINDLDNYNYKVIYVRNPYNSNGSPMILFFEKDIKKLFINKYSNIITNELHYIVENNNNDFIIINQTIEYLNNINNNKKNSIVNKLFIKFKITENELPEEYLHKINLSKTTKGIEDIIKQYFKKNKLYKILLENNIEEYIDMDICIKYIEGKTDLDEYDIKNKIIYLLNKKNMIKIFIKQNNLPKKKYLNIYNNYLNSDDDDFYNLLDIINKLENNK